MSYRVDGVWYDVGCQDCLHKSYRCWACRSFWDSRPNHSGRRQERGTRHANRANKWQWDEHKEQKMSDTEHVVAEIQDFLMGIGTDYAVAYYQLFIRNGFDTMELVKTLTDDDLRNEIGISKLGHRRKILMECQNQNQSNDTVFDHRRLRSNETPSEAYYRVAVEFITAQMNNYLQSQKQLVQTNFQRLLENKHILDESFKSHSDWTESSGHLSAFDCNICYRSFERIQQISILECSHFNCLECLRGMLQPKLETRNVTKIACPFSGVDRCDHTLTYQEIKCILNERDFERYDSYLLQNTMDAARDCKPCPGVNCGNSIFGVEELPMVNCPTCQLQFCFNCLEHDWHLGITCDQYKQWKDENGRGDAAFEQWQRDNGTKQCPRCSVTIQKNEGCDHMTCRACKHEFSWTTLRQWSNVMDPRMHFAWWRRIRLTIDVDCKMRNQLAFNLFLVDYPFPFI